jgi:hypothetical protein
MSPYSTLIDFHLVDCRFPLLQRSRKLVRTVRQGRSSLLGSAVQRAVGHVGSYGLLLRPPHPRKTQELCLLQPRSFLYRADRS